MVGPLTSRPSLAKRLRAASTSKREPITDANRDAATAGADLTDEEHEVVLHEEEVVVDKQTVPKERVRMDTDVTADEQQVTEQLRKEQIETEGTPQR